jgi:hypothetical protein
VLFAGNVNATPRRPDWVACDFDESSESQRSSSNVAHEHNVTLQDAFTVGKEGASPTSVPWQSQDRGTNIGYAN